MSERAAIVAYLRAKSERSERDPVGVRMLATDIEQGLHLGSASSTQNHEPRPFALTDAEADDLETLRGALHQQIEDMVNDGAEEFAKSDLADLRRQWALLGKVVQMQRMDGADATPRTVLLCPVCRGRLHSAPPAVPFCHFCWQPRPVAP